MGRRSPPYVVREHSAAGQRDGYALRAPGLTARADVCQNR